MSNSGTPNSYDAFWQVNDEKIKSAIYSLDAAGLPINIAKITDQLTDCIVNSYNNTTSLYTYKSSWCIRIGQILSELNFTYVGSVFKILRNSWYTSIYTSVNNLWSNF